MIEIVLIGTGVYLFIGYVIAPFL